MAIEINEHSVFDQTVAQGLPHLLSSKSTHVIGNPDGTDGRVLGIDEATPTRGRHRLAGIVNGRWLTEGHHVWIQMCHPHGRQGGHRTALTMTREDHALVRVGTFLGTFVEGPFDLLVVGCMVGIVKSLPGVAADGGIHGGAHRFRPGVKVLVPIHKGEGRAAEDAP